MNPHKDYKAHSGTQYHIHRVTKLCRIRNMLAEVLRAGEMEALSTSNFLEGGRTSSWTQVHFFTYLYLAVLLATIPALYGICQYRCHDSSPVSKGTPISPFLQQKTWFHPGQY